MKRLALALVLVAALAFAAMATLPVDKAQWGGTAVTYHEIWGPWPGGSVWIHYVGATGNPALSVTANIYAWYDVSLAKNSVDYVISSGLPQTWVTTDANYFQTWGNGTGGYWLDITQGITAPTNPDANWPNLKADLVAQPDHPYPAARPVAQWGMLVNGCTSGIDWKGSADNGNVTNIDPLWNPSGNTWGVAWGVHHTPSQPGDWFMCGTQVYDGYLYHRVKIDNALKMGPYRSDAVIGAAPVL